MVQCLHLDPVQNEVVFPGHSFLELHSVFSIGNLSGRWKPYQQLTDLFVGE